MLSKTVIWPERLRQIPRKFNWVDHRLVHERHLGQISSEACTLYLFLLTVSDREGLSYYSDRRLCELTPIRELHTCRNDLIKADLVAYQNGLYQLLSLPEEQKAISPKLASNSSFKKANFSENQQAFISKKEISPKAQQARSLNASSETFPRQSSQEIPESVHNYLESFL